LSGCLALVGRSVGRSSGFRQRRQATTANRMPLCPKNTIYTGPTEYRGSTVPRDFIPASPRLTTQTTMGNDTRRMTTNRYNRPTDRQTNIVWIVFYMLDVIPSFAFCAFSGVSILVVNAILVDSQKTILLVCPSPLGHPSRARAMSVRKGKPMQKLGCFHSNQESS
jgi:hypothetical protein